MPQLDWITYNNQIWYTLCFLVSFFTLIAFNFIPWVNKILKFRYKLLLINNSNPLINNKKVILLNKWLKL